MLSIEEELEILKSGRAAVLGLAGESLLGPALACFAVVKIIKAHSDKQIQALLEKTRADENCPHIHNIDGWTQPFNDMIYCLSQKQGTAWQNGDGNPLWYYHPQNRFLPDKFVRGWTGRPIAGLRKGDGSPICEQCQRDEQIHQRRIGKLR